MTTSNGVYAAELAELATLRAATIGGGGLKCHQQRDRAPAQGHLRCRARAQHRRSRQPVRDRRQLAEAHRDPRADRPDLSGTGGPDRAVRLPDHCRPVAAPGRQVGGDGLILLRRMRTVAPAAARSAGAIGTTTTANEQGQWHEDGKGGTVEGEHGFCSSSWVATYRMAPVRKTGQNRIHCLVLLDNPP